MRTADLALRRVRAFCLSLPETSEVDSWGHPNFRAGKRTFATFEWVAKRPSIAFRLDTVDADLLVRRKNFFATPYGRGQWVSLWADGRVNWRMVERLLQRSYRMVALERMIAALDNALRKDPADHAMEPAAPTSSRPRRDSLRGTNRKPISPRGRC